MNYQNPLVVLCIVIKFIYKPTFKMKKKTIPVTNTLTFNIY